MLVPPGVLVGAGGTVLAEGSRLEARVVVAEALVALVLGEHAADDALARGGLEDVRHVQQLARQDPVVNLELPPEPVQEAASGFARFSS